MFGPLLLVFDNLNPSPSSVSPWGGASGTNVGGPIEYAKGNPQIWTVSPPTTSPLRGIPSNPNRRELFVYNNGANPVEMWFEGAQAAGTGMIIPANSYIPFPLTRHVGELWFQATTETGNVRIWETSAD